MQIGRIISITGKQNGKKNNENKRVFHGILVALENKRGKRFLEIMPTERSVALGNMINLNL